MEPLISDQNMVREQARDRKLETWKVIATFLDTAARLADLWHR